MVAEIGLLLLIIALTLAISVSVFPAITYHAYKDRHQPHPHNETALLMHLTTLALVASIALLTVLFLMNDFSVVYVANHSNSQLATIFKVAAVWGGHEGSLLLWIVLIALFASIVIETNKDKAEFCYYFSVASALILFGFLCFLIFTSNPFARLLPNIPIEGRDLNPILQNIGLVFHPPLLFMGYVGLTICFAGTMATLFAPVKHAHQHLMVLKPWVIFSWVTLTGGNAFGSWWAYNELGWGGWWFWDPVENASFIPWLAATAYLHSIILNERFKRYYASTLFIGLLAFSLCLLGTFLVRSGVVQSVHAFASDPSRGMSILALLLSCTVVGFTVFIYKLPLFMQAAALPQHRASPIKINKVDTSTSLWMYLGILLLIVAAISVLIGTCYPLLYQVVVGHTISVGAPFFNFMFVPMVLLISLCMGLVPLLRFRRQAHFKIHLITMLALSGVIACACLWLTTADWLYFCGCLSASWLFISLSYCVWQFIQRPSGAKLRFSAMVIAHLGVMFSIIGATTVSNFEQQELLRMGPGQGKEMAGYTFIYRSTEEVTANSYSAIQANIEIQDNKGSTLTTLTPQRRTFNTNAMQLSAASVHSSLTGDLYVSMGQALSEDEFLIRLSYKPLVNWIWLGAGLMMFAGTLCLIYFRRVSISQRQTLASPLENTNECTPSTANQVKEELI
ncbi:heme lyase CcmF/NrfE family subunit [Shewanella maritima]|uniref:heme lyase CcmF/NrfE family subunit n=1 Tax=Shewanella maritima TaxID=2520507 RepID=UPI0037362DEB